MDIRQLRNFLGVLAAGSLTRAAVTLRVAQPALGLQIRTLERELGVALLVRGPRGVAPTQAGELLARHAELLLRQVDRARQEVMEFDRVPRGRIVLGLTGAVSQVMVAAIVERCSRTFPDVRLVVTLGRSKPLIQMVMDGEVDLAFSFHPRPGADLVNLPLADETLMLVEARGEVPLPPEIDFPAMLEQELILPAPPHLLREMVDAAVEKHGGRLKIYCAVDSVMTMKELARRGLAPTVLPLGAVHQEVINGDLRVRRIAGADLRRTLHLVGSVRRPPSKALEAVWHEVQAVARTFAEAGEIGWSPAPGSPPAPVRLADLFAGG